MKQIIYFFFGVLFFMTVENCAWSFAMIPEPMSTHSPSHIAYAKDRYSLHPHAAHFHPYLPITKLNEFALPLPHKTTYKAKVISLRDAIALALRNNPGIEIAELGRINDKYALEEAWHVFQPHFTLGGNLNTQTRVRPTYTVTGGVSLQTPIGTQFSIDETNDLHGLFGTATFTMTQPLLKGFGKVNMVDYLNELDNQKEDRLTFKSTIMTQVAGVITAYRTLVSDYNQLEIQRRTFVASKKTVEDDKLRVKAGQLARSELLQDQVTLETNRLSMTQSENTVQTDYQALLTAIGLVSDAKLKVDTHIDVDSDKMPSLKQAIRLALAGNTDYQKAVIGLRETERALITAKDARKWTLGLTVTGKIGAEKEDGIISSTDELPSAALALTVPIDDITTKAGLVSAQIAIETAKINLQQQKETLIRSVVNSINTLKSDKEQIKINQEQVNLQRIALKNTKLQYQYGQATSLSVSQQQSTLLSNETSLVSEEITYLNDITTLHQTTGTLLHKWGIKLRY